MTVLVPAEQVRQAGEQYATALAGARVRRGDRVAIVTPEHRGTPDQAAAQQAHVLCLVLGALRSGVVPVLINPLLTVPERRRIIRDCRPALVLEEPGEAEALLRGDRAPVDLADHPLCRPMHYTSGTTGHPKGVWTADLSEAESAALWQDEQDLWRFGTDDVSLVHGPLCHSGPLRFALAVVLAGGSVALPGWFDTGRIAAAMLELRPTTAFVVPSHLQRLFEAGVPPSPYRLLAHAGSACPPGLKRRLHEWAGPARVWEFYGSTEGQFTACSAPEWEQRPGTVGRARAGRRLELDDGVIWCHAPSFARFRYWGDDERTARAWRGDAFSVGDLGRLDGDGYLFIEGRREDLIISGGVNVYPAEVEEALSACPGVREVAVFGRPDELWGQAVCAAYLGDADPQEVRRWAAERLAGYKRPKSIERVAEFPRTASGKILRLELG